MGREGSTARVVDVAEACAALRIGRTTLYKLIGSGALATVKIGRARRVPVASIAKLIRQTTRSGR